MTDNSDSNNEIIDEEGDPSVPAELLEIHLALEESGSTPEEFKEVFGHEDGP